MEALPEEELERIRVRDAQDSRYLENPRYFAGHLRHDVHATVYQDRRKLLQHIRALEEQIAHIRSSSG